MTKTTFIAVDPNGVEHKRTSDRRRYTHTVVFLPNFELDMARAGQKWEADGDNWEFACQMVEWGGVFQGQRKPWQTDEEIAEKLARAKESAGEYTSREAAIEGGRQKRIARIAGAKAEGYYDRFRNAGWCGRIDLAQKLAKSTEGLKVTILEVNVPSNHSRGEDGSK